LEQEMQKLDPREPGDGGGAAHAGAERCGQAGAATAAPAG
jgi:hypothetical protein